MSVTSTECAAAATAASGEAPGRCGPSNAYGLDRRSMALRASWMAICMLAYTRDSWSGLSTGARQAAVAALPAFSFQARTASVGAADAVGARGLAGCRAKAVAVRPTTTNVRMSRIPHLTSALWFAV